jgi:hypothetical protein
LWYDGTGRRTQTHRRQALKVAAIAILLAANIIAAADVALCACVDIHAAPFVTVNRDEQKAVAAAAKHASRPLAAAVRTVHACCTCCCGFAPAKDSVADKGTAALVEGAQHARCAAHVLAALLGGPRPSMQQPKTHSTHASDARLSYQSAPWYQLTKESASVRNTHTPLAIKSAVLAACVVTASANEVALLANVIAHWRNDTRPSVFQTSALSE